MRYALTGAALLTALLFSACRGAEQGPPQGAVPRTPDGKPDLQGIWQAMTTAAHDIQDHHARLGVPPGQGVVDGNTIPYQPWALEKTRQNFATRATADPEAKGYMPGVPRIMYMAFPFQVFQTPEHVTLVFEYAGANRILYTNGTPHPRGPITWWLGDSRGRWESDTLVVDVVHFTDQTWFDRAGNFHSDVLHLVERYTLVGPDHLQYEVTVEDPKVFTRPWKMSLPLYRRKEANVRLLEYVPSFLMQQDEVERERQTP